MVEQLQADRTRRPGIASYPVMLADGNFWGLALPRARFRPKVVRGLDELGRPTETIQIETEFGYPLEIRRLINELRQACARGTAERQHESLFRLAAALIRRAHDLDLAAIAELLEIDLQDLPEFVETVVGVVTGEHLDSPDSSRKKEADA